jgi:PAS domain S-box-containing protein
MAPFTPGPRPGPAVDRPKAPPGRAHVVQFYDDEEQIASAVATFVADGLSAQDVVTTIATREHTDAIDRCLRAAAVDPDAARESGRLVSLDAHETLARFMRNGEPDPRLFEAVIGGLMADRVAAAKGAGVRVYGEMVGVLWKGGDRSAALHLEDLWNELQARQPSTLLCAYAMGKFYKEPTTIHSVGAAHTQIADLQTDADPRGTAVRTTGFAPDHDQVLAREILHREEVELALRESLRQLRAREDDLRQTEEQLRDFVENGTVALHRVDGDGRIVWANRAELDLLGYTRGEFVGRPIADFHVDQALIADILARLLRGEVLHDVEARLRAKDGTTKHVLISSSGYFREGKFVHSRCFTRDITEHLLCRPGPSIPFRERDPRAVVRPPQVGADRSARRGGDRRRRLRGGWPVHCPRHGR